MKSVIAASALDDATKATLTQAIDTSANFPGLLSNVLERVKTALSN